MFLQMGCVIPADELAARKIIGLIASCLAISIGLFCVIYFDYVKQLAANDYVEHDVKTVTAGDYSVEFKIDSEFFRNGTFITSLPGCPNRKQRRISVIQVLLSLSETGFNMSLNNAYLKWMT